MGTWIAILVVAVIVVAVLIALWVMYNGLVSARLRVKVAWSGIDVQLKRRSSLIPNLAGTGGPGRQHPDQRVAFALRRR